MAKKPQLTEHKTDSTPTHPDSEPYVDIIKKGKKEWKKTVDAIDDIITILDTKLHITRANLTVQEEFGEIIGKKCHDVFHNSKEPCENCPVLKTIEDSNIHRSLMYLEYSSKTLDITGSPVFDEDGQLSNIIHVARDITDTLHQEAERKRLSTAIEQASEIIVVTDCNGTIMYTNPAFSSVTGYSRSEALGSNMSIIKSGEHDQNFYQALQSHLRSGKVWKGKFINRRKDGSLYPEESTISPIIDSNGNITSFVAVKRDVSKEEALEKQLQQAKKLEAIGTLAGGIAHDFNNILSSILGYAHIAKEHIEENPAAERALNHIVSSGDKAAELVKQILTFSRQEQSPDSLKQLRIQYILKETLKLLRSSLPATIKLTQNIDKNCAPILANAGDIHQLIMNLCTNAKQAIDGDHGSITIELSPVNSDSSVLLTINDNGCGMDQEKIERIFDPFYTTRPKKYGTGLGMSVVHGIVKKHNAKIDITSRPDQGTRVSILFPSAMVNQEKYEPAAGKAVGGNERIMVVDDEPQLLEFLQFALKRLGYKVTPFYSSIAAVRYFRMHSDAFDLVITDMTMPDMTGAELAREVLSLTPTMPIILTTGYSETIDKKKARRLGIKELMLKPLRKRDLADTIRKVLDNG